MAPKLTSYELYAILWGRGGTEVKVLVLFASNEFSKIIH